MKACVFAGNLAVLMNGSPTQEIGVQMGLKQEYPLAHFIFILVVQGLSGLVVRTKELDLYSGFKVGISGLVMYHLQYVDDTFLMVDSSIENIWCIKVILRGF